MNASLLPGSVIRATMHGELLSIAGIPGMHLMWWGFRVSWKSGTRQTFDSKAFMADHPEMDFSGYCKESSARTFRVTEQKGA